MKRLTLRNLLSTAALVALAGGMALTPRLHAAQTLLWSDDFNGSSVDTTKWTVLNTSDGSKSKYLPANVTVANGELDIANLEVGTGDSWSGGGVVTASEFPLYNYLEARVKFSSRYSFDWGTWWTVGVNADGSTHWPPEMDICELMGGTTNAINEGPDQYYHWTWGGSVNAETGGHVYTDESQWHSYGVYWASNYIINCAGVPIINGAPVFYVDGIMSIAPVAACEDDQIQARLKITSSPDSQVRTNGCPLSTMEVDYVRVYDTPPAQPTHVSNLALNKPTIASSYKYTGGVPDLAVDGADGSGSVTRWESNWQDPQWICVDLQAVCSITSVVLNWQNAAAATYDIQVSSQWWGPWTNCISVTGNTAGWHTNTFAAQTGRYVRVNGKTRTTTYGYSLYDIQVYGTVVNPNPGAAPARPNLALNKWATASSVESGGTLTPNLAVDGDYNTRWGSAFSSPQWICIDIGATNPVDTVMIDYQAAASSSYYIQVANDTNGTWTTVYSYMTVSNNTPGVKYDMFPSVNCRYVQVVGVSRTETSYGHSILELQIYGGAATNSGGGSAPAAPTGLTPTVVSSSQINLAWNASTGATSYNVYRSTTNGGPYAVVASGLTATSYSDSGLAASTTYYYVVTAVNANGESAYSSQVSATTQCQLPSVPTGLTPTVVSSSQINLSWTASSGATSYSVYRSTNSAGPFTAIATGVSVTSYNNTGLAASTTYYYYVVAVNSCGSSGNSSTVNATTQCQLPSAPTGLTPIVISSNQINLSWTASSGATSYNVYRSTNSAGPFTAIATGVSVTSYNDTGLAASTTYYYYVVAVNSCGSSGNSSTVNATTSPIGGNPPPTPTGLSATAVATNQINLTWNASTGATSYNLGWATVSNGPYSSITGISGTSYNNTGLTPNTTYYYVVSAVNSYGASANSAQVYATTPPMGGGTDVLLSQGHPVTASSSQSGYAATNGNDGNLSTRWGASSSSYPQWWRVDLGASHTLHTVIVDWLSPTSRAYNYTIDVSADGTNYTTVVTATNRVSGKIYGNTTNSISVTDRYLRVTVTGASGGNASFYECQVMGQ